MFLFQCCLYEQTNGFAALVILLNAQIASACAADFPSPGTPLSLPQLSCCCPPTYITVLTYADCVSTATDTLFKFFACVACAEILTPTTEATTTTTAVPSFLKTASEAAPIATAVVAGGMVFMPTMPIVNTQGVPPGNVSPGTPGGGAPPSVNTPNGIAALALVPLGTLPVAIFPPYATPRTKDAVSVIFAENPEIISMNRVMTRFKRSLFRRAGFRNSQRKITYLDSMLERAQYARR